MRAKRVFGCLQDWLWVLVLVLIAAAIIVGRYEDPAAFAPLQWQDIVLVICLILSIILIGMSSLAPGLLLAFLLSKPLKAGKFPVWGYYAATIGLGLPAMFLILRWAAPRALALANQILANMSW